MFDPTAFDNMKVVIEGAIYDLDLDGEINIIDRNDLINLAKMSRSFDVSFKLTGNRTRRVTAKLILGSNLENLAAELLPDSLSEKDSGSMVRLEFQLESTLVLEDYKQIEAKLLDIWGETRKVRQKVQYNPMGKDQEPLNIFTVEFERLVREEQIDDLVGMVEFMVTTILELSQFTPKPAL
jgi:hypothetical protein